MWQNQAGRISKPDSTCIERVESMRSGGAKVRCAHSRWVVVVNDARGDSVMPWLAKPGSNGIVRQPNLTRRDIWVNLLLYPGHTLTTAAAPVIVAVGLALHNHVFAPVPALVGFLGSWLIHVGGVFTDNYQLLRKFPHLQEHPELVQAVENGSLRLSHLRGAIIVCFGTALLAAPYLLHIGGILVLIFGIIGILASISYAGGICPYAKRGFADLLFFLMFGIVAVVATYYIQIASVRGITSFYSISPDAFPRAVFVIGLPIGALVTNVLIIDDIRDHEFDAVKGWRTGAVRYGVEWSRAEFTALMVFAYLAPLCFWLALGYDAWVLLPLLTVPWAFTTVHAIRTLEQPTDLLPMTPKMAQLSLIYPLLLATGIAVSNG